MAHDILRWREMKEDTAIWREMAQDGARLGEKTSLRGKKRVASLEFMYSGFPF